MRASPLYQAMPTLQRVSSAPRSSAIQEPLPRWLQRVARLLSSTLAGTLPSSPMARTLCAVASAQLLGPGVAVGFGAGVGVRVGRCVGGAVGGAGLVGSGPEE